MASEETMVVRVNDYDTIKMTGHQQTYRVVAVTPARKMVDFALCIYTFTLENCLPEREVNIFHVTLVINSRTMRNLCAITL